VEGVQEFLIDGNNAVVLIITKKSKIKNKKGRERKELTVKLKHLPLG
jgi:hypothetical protein